MRRSGAAPEPREDVLLGVEDLELGQHPHKELELVDAVAVGVEALDQVDVELPRHQRLLLPVRLAQLHCVQRAARHTQLGGMAAVPRRHATAVRAGASGPVA
jgi:hypothetical protein